MGMRPQIMHNCFDPEVFFSTYWRQKPLFVRGGAEGFLGCRWSEADFEVAYAKARSEGHTIKEQIGKVTFIEKVSAFDSDLAARATQFGHTFAVPQVWFDAVRTYSSSGIGAHFDHSDNFVLQQGGVKEWMLAPPRHIGRADIARRMMNVPGIGAHALPEEGNLRFVLEPGDLLYIPLFWLHSGVSRSNSLSLSLVCPAISLYSAVMPFLTRAMKERVIGYQPIQALHAHLSPEDRREAVKVLRQATQALLNSVADDELLKAVQAMQTERLPGITHPEA